MFGRGFTPDSRSLPSGPYIDRFVSRTFIFSLQEGSGVLVDERNPVNSPVVEVDSRDPIIFPGDFIHPRRKRWLGMGFMNHQQQKWLIGRLGPGGLGF